MEWGKITIEELIEKWRNYPLLYNVKLDEYKDRNKKKKALDKIAEEMGTTGEYRCVLYS